MKLTIITTDGTFDLRSKPAVNKKQAVQVAREWAEKYPNESVYITFFRPTDGQHGFLNPNGFGISGHPWAAESK